MPEGETKRNSQRLRCEKNIPRLPQPRQRMGLKGRRRHTIAAEPAPYIRMRCCCSGTPDTLAALTSLRAGVGKVAHGEGCGACLLGVGRRPQKGLSLSRTEVDRAWTCATAGHRSTLWPPPGGLRRGRAGPFWDSRAGGVPHATLSTVCRGGGTLWPRNRPSTPWPVPCTCYWEWDPWRGGRKGAWGWVQGCYGHGPLPCSLVERMDNAAGYTWGWTRR